MLKPLKLETMFLLIYFLFSMLFLSACGSDASSNNHDKSAGTYQAALVFPAAVPRLTSEGATADRIDCKAAAIATIEFHFSVNGEQRQPYTFDCADGGGILEGVPAGEEVVVEVFANNADGIPLLKGSEKVTVTPGKKTVGGEIEMEYIPFPNTSLPSDANTQADQDENTSTDTDSAPFEEQDASDEPSAPDDETPTEADTTPETDTPQEPDTDLPEEEDNDSSGANTSPAIPTQSFSNEIGMRFVRIPAGTFMMGSPTDELGRDDDEALHQVTITNDYYMQTTEVTQRQWVTVMQSSNPSYFSSCGGNCPVESVSWNEIRQFISTLNLRYEGNFTYRLPTEAEWEYAARAGSRTAFPNGDISVLGCNYDQYLDAIGWYCFNSSVDYDGCVDNSDNNGHQCSGTHPVGQRSPNGFGLYDMNGNVGEFCQDYYGPFPTGQVRDYTGPESGFGRVSKGGNWRTSTRGCRSARRQGADPDLWWYTAGFRLICTPQN